MNKYLHFQDIVVKDFGKIFGEIADVLIKSISIDSRSLEKGDLFIALRGPSNDGHKFIKVAERKGASCFVVEENINTKKPYILVDDTYKFMNKLALQKREEFKGTVISVTGSNGKTTTKEILYSILSSVGPCHKTKGNKNNQIGVPLSLSSLNKENRFSIIEIGSNSPGEINQLSQIVRPNVGLITNATSSHLEGLGSIGKVAFEKGFILENIEKEGAAILPRDSLFFEEWTKRAKALRVISFGTSRKSDVLLESVKMNVSKNLMFFKIRSLGSVLECQMKTIGIHNAINASAAFAVALALDLDLEKLSKNLMNVKFPSRRLSVHKARKDSLLIDDSYNANPESMKRSLDVLDKMRYKQRFFVAGEMAELGSDGEFYHEEICKYSKGKTDEFLCIGDLWKSGLKKTSFKGKKFNTKDDLFDYLINKINKDSVIMVKGSRSSSMEYIVDKLKI